MRKCPCPLWVIKPGQNARYSRILAAVDPGPVEGGVDDLNAKIMELATSLARHNGSELDIIHAWDLTGADLDTSKSEISDEIRNHLLSKHLNIYSQRLQALLEHCTVDDIHHQTHVVRGDPTVVIPELTHNEPIDLIVMGSVGRCGVAGLFIGTTAELALRQVQCAVLTVKPTGFVTPVAAVRPSVTSSAA